MVVAENELFLLEPQAAEDKPVEFSIEKRPLDPEGNRARVTKSFTD